MVCPPILTEPDVVESFGKRGSASFVSFFGGLGLLASWAGAWKNATISRSVPKPKRVGLKRAFTEGRFLAEKWHGQYLSLFQILSTGRCRREDRGMNKVAVGMSQIKLPKYKQLLSPSCVYVERAARM